eukprot:1764499-Prymnesium_polylepis.1
MRKYPATGLCYQYGQTDRSGRPVIHEPIGVLWAGWARWCAGFASGTRREIVTDASVWVSVVCVVF